MLFSIVLSLATAASSNPLPQNVNANSKSSKNTLSGCLQAANAPITVQSSPDWSTDIRPYNLRIQFTPAVIVTATDPSHVQAAVKCGAQYGYKVTGRGGGHSYSSSGFGGENGHVVVQLDEMYQVTLNSDNTATIQAGARLGHVASELYNQGGRAISHGSCPGVGISGHGLHGGYGLSSHKYGMTLDWIIEATVVLASGKIVTCSQSQNPDLFWALRGAGSSFGIVTSFKFDTFEAPSVVTWFSIPVTFKKADKLVNTILGLQKYGQGDMPAELTMQMLVAPYGVYFDGLYYGDEDETRNVLQGFMSPLGIDISAGTISQTDWLGQLNHFAGGTLDVTGTESATDTFYASSLATTVVPRSGFKAFIDYLQNTAVNVSRSWFIQIDVHGGPNSRTAQIPASSTSYAHRDKVLLWQFYDSSGGAAYPKTGTSFLKNWMAAVTNTMSPTDWGRYANYADSTLSNVDAQSQYYMQSLPRLQVIKKQYDPNGLFTYPQGVQLS